MAEANPESTDQNAKMVRGLVVRAYSSFYYVRPTGGDHSPASCDDPPLECRVRGRLKQCNQKEAGTERLRPWQRRWLREPPSIPPVVVGDWVQVEPLGARTGVIVAVEQRRSLLLRPLLANVETLVVVFALVSPDPAPLQVDRFLVTVEKSGIRPIVVFNKADLVSEDQCQRWVQAYRAAGYPVVATSACTGQGLSELAALLSGGISAFAGPSGVGKSALLKRFFPGLDLASGEVSAKTGRGRHTTRYAQLLPLGGGWVADTPGFSTPLPVAVEPARLAQLFPEMRVLLGQCRFSGCLHRREPGCAVRAAVDAGKILPARYDSYLRILEEVEAQALW